ncbi:hypothetical protein KJ359_008818 [Pestalotiopsis sp. 9143b]|nr:hypothetical protein KJ359_008818 [Pestalotiopsis sp. 9143b]
MAPATRTLTMTITTPPPNEQTRTCRRCNRPVQRRITKQSNRNGNAGRPYYRCVPCNKFIAFDDDRGRHEDNPLCECGLPSRTQLNGLYASPPRGVHYVCGTGKCNYYARLVKDEKQVVVEEDLVERFARALII